MERLALALAALCVTAGAGAAAALECNATSPCIFKCCPRGLVPEDTECAPGNDSLFFWHWRPLQRAGGDETNISSLEEHFAVLYGQPCRYGKYVLEDPQDRHILMDNGSLRFTEDALLLVPPDQFCIDVLGDEVVTFQCVSELDLPPSNVMFIIYPVCMLLSAPFLALTACAYASVQRLRNVHGRCLISHSLALLTAYLSLSSVQLGTLLDTIGDAACTGTAFIIYFSFLASFFWLNVMCIDIWWTFSGFRPMRGSVKEREHKKFIIYSLYCWGSPLLMLTVTMIMDLHPGVPETYLKPGFGKRNCWFERNEGTLYYFLGPIAILILSNTVLFILTAIKIRQLKNETEILKEKGSKRHDDDENNTQRFNLYLKLFLVMGVNWIMEVVSWLAGGPEYFWYITDVANTLQGVLIFVIFVCKERIWRLLTERFCPKRGFSMNTSRSLPRSSPSRSNTLSTRASVKSTNLEEYRTKPLMETSRV